MNDYEAYVRQQEEAIRMERMALARAMQVPSTGSMGATAIPLR